MKKLRFTRACGLLLAVALTAALALQPAAADEPPALTGFSVDLVTQCEMTAGGVSQLSATVIPEPAGASIGASDVEWSWSCERQDILKLDDTDKATVILQAQAHGTAKVIVTATVQMDGRAVSHEASCTVTVLPAAATRLNVTPQSATMDEKETQDLSASVSEYADPEDVTWTSSNDSIVHVSSERGRSTTITARAPGTATVTASSGDTAKGVCSVEVRGVALSRSSLTLTVGRSETLGATPYGGIGSRVEWESGNDSVAYVSAGGVVTGQSAGKARITATIGGYSAVCEVTVQENTANIITDDVGTGRTFSFEDIRGELNSRCWDMLSESLQYVTNLSVPTDQGILYYSYVSQEDPGHALGSSERYYYSNSAGERGLAGISFVPNSGFTGTAVIRYSGYGSGSKFFTGTIQLDVKGGASVAYTTTSTAPVAFLASEFSAVCRERTGREMDYVTFDLPASSRGTLYYDYSGPGQYSEKVSGSTQYYRTHSAYLDRVSFVPNEDYTGTFRVSYRCVDTSGSAFSGQVSITVTRGGGAGSGDVNYSVNQNSSVTFRASDFNSACRTANGESLKYITFSLPSSSRGTLYYNYRSSNSYGSKVSASTRYYRTGSPSISDVTFVPNRSFDGTVNIDFSGYDDDGERFAGQVSIRVSEDGGDYGEVRYETDRNKSIDFQASDFNDACLDVNNARLNYIRFVDLPSSSEGTLYYNYRSSGSYDSKVSTGTWYYRSGSPSISNLTFVPKSTFEGTVHLEVKGYDMDGTSFTGSVRIVVGNDRYDGGEVRYSVAQNGTVDFRASDFNDASLDFDNAQLSYVRFTLPSTSVGTLYYNYRSSGSYDSKVSASTSYYRSGTPSLSKITFVPKSTYSGTAAISYKGYDVNGRSFSGTVRIEVGGAGDGEVRYTVGRDSSVAFRATDFNNACLDVNDAQLSYVRFTLPSTSVGTLYYNYRTNGSYDSKVSANTSYYRSGSPSISNITFIPKSTYTGTAAVTYKAYDVNGRTYTGTVSIEVEGDGRPPLQYAVTSGQVLSFDADDFNTVCRDETGNTLSYVQFKLPASSRGVLYYRYDKDKETYTSKVSASTSYYRTGGTRALEDVSFVPAEDYVGPVEVDFSGWSTGGKKFTGTVEIEVTAQTAAVIRYTGSAAPIHLRASDFRAACSAIQRQELSYVQFSSLPGAAAGQLYADYAGPGQQGSLAHTDVSYYSSRSPGLDQLSFVPKAGFQGQTVLQYTGFDAKGKKFAGIVEITVADAYCITPFTDMEHYQWAKPSAEFLRQVDVVNGISTSAFGPGERVTRGDFALMLCRAFRFRTESTSSFPDVNPNSYYGWAVATAKDMGIVQGAGGGNYLPDHPLTRQEAMVMIWRAMNAAGIYTSIGSTTRLDTFADHKQVADFAKEAVASMVEMELVSGTSDGLLQPEATISRGEMAVILHRVLTL